MPIREHRLAFSVPPPVQNSCQPGTGQSRGGNRDWIPGRPQVYRDRRHRADYANNRSDHSQGDSMPHRVMRRIASKDGVNNSIGERQKAQTRVIDRFVPWRIHLENLQHFVGAKGKNDDCGKSQSKRPRTSAQVPRIIAADYQNPCAPV